MVDEVPGVGTPTDGHTNGQQSNGQDGPRVVKISERHKEHGCPHLA